MYIGFWSTKSDQHLTVRLDFKYRKWKHFWCSHKKRAFNREKCRKNVNKYITIEYILRHFSKVHTLYAIISSCWVCIQKPYSDVVILICYSIYYSGYIGRTSGFCSHQKNKACQEKTSKKCQRSHMKRCTYLVYAATYVVYNKRIGKLFTVLEKISTLGLKLFFRQNVVVRVGLTRTTKFQAWLVAGLDSSFWSCTLALWWSNAFGNHQKPSWVLTATSCLFSSKPGKFQNSLP